ncbi:hypothetical protein HDE68_004158 [Pedobacter cryoconitis]|uniref:Alginate lyase domain-containing protein n=2 Tax=Pedobacter cryoconitis TaxID=188932 RepID=A0A7W8ZQC9_9SPHI|nr:hypothetical protein [Pedobacter cryoconitis]
MKMNKTKSWLLCLGLVTLTAFLIECKKSVAADSGNNQVGNVNTSSTQVAFVHPGLLNTQASLDLVASQVNGGDADRTAAYQKVTDFINSHQYPTSFPATVVVGSNGATSPSKNQIRNDSELVYATALRWAKTGNSAYAAQAIAILNGWAKNFKNYGLLDSSTNPNQPDLEASWTTPGFVAAAEIIRYYKVNGQSAGWSEADIAQFSAFITLVKDNYINKIPQYNNNWDASAGYAKMAIGIFLNSTSVYQNGYDFIKTNLPIVINADGTLPELCVRKDCVHYQYSLTAFAYAAELARIQGDNSIWTANSNLISKGYDFMRKAYNRTTGCDYCTINSPVFPGTEVAYNYYKTANLKSLREMQTPLGVPNDNTFLGFTTYTHFGVAGL